MDPISIGVMAGVGAIGSLAGGVIGAAGAEYQAGAQANMLNYQAAIARTNQQIAEQNAAYDRQKGEEDAWTQGQKTKAEVAGQRVAYAAGNLDVNVGSPANVRASTIALGQQNEAIVRSNAARKAYGDEIQAWSSGTEAQLDVMGAKTAKTAGDISALGSIVGGVSSFGSKWASAGQYFGKSV